MKQIAEDTYQINYKDEQIEKVTIKFNGEQRIENMLELIVQQLCKEKGIL